MRHKRKLYNFILISLVIIPFAINAGCKKQPKCGCDGDALDSLAQSHVLVYYDAEKKSAQCTGVNDPYSIFYFCNPSAVMGELTKYEQGGEVLLSGSFFYECNYLMSSSNSYYPSLYRIYQIEVTAVEPDLYGK
ncbi:MAG: hypothetical protein MUP53_01980 [Bacteroidales bacterium]|nr:hypothetical protein [Bacteroidales bacterium]